MMLIRRARSWFGALCALAILAVPAILVGCSFESGGFIVTLPAHVRFFNVMIGGGPIDVTISKNNVINNLPFEGLTGYQNIDAGLNEVKISVAGGDATILDTTTLFIDDSSSTFLIYGTSSAPAAQQVSDVLVNPPGENQFLLRVTNAAYGSVGLDVYVTLPGVALDNLSPNVSNAGYGAITTFTLFTPATYQVRMTLPNTKQVIYDGGTFAFAERTTYSLIAYTRGSGVLVNAALLVLDTSGTGAIANSRIAQVKVVNAAPGTSPVNAYVDGNVAFANIPFQGASSYELLSAGTHTVAFEAMTSPGAIIASTQAPFVAATDTSVIVTGTPGAQTAVTLNDNNLPGTPGNARVRFVNMAPNVGPVDVYVNFALRAANVDTNTASAYIELPENAYSVSFDVAGTTSILLTLPSVSVTSGNTFSLYLMGTTGQLSGVLTRDD